MAADKQVLVYSLILNITQYPTTTKWFIINWIAKEEAT